MNHSLNSVLLVHHSNDMYGADMGLLHTLETMDLGRFHPIVILPADSPSGLLAPELARRGIEFHFLPLGILRRKYLKALTIVPLAIEILTAVVKLHRLIRQRRVVMVYANTLVTMSGGIAGKLAGVPVIWHIREIPVLQPLTEFLTTGALRFCATTVVCVSNAVRDNLLRQVPNLAPRLKVIYNATTLERSDAATREAPIREIIGISRDTLLVGMVGRVTHWKGQEVLAEAAAIVLQKHPEVHFVAVGSHFEGELHYLTSLQDRIARLGLADRFHLLDYRRDVRAVYDALDVFVLPSTKPEPFGRVTVEAMMQGKAVVATDHGGTRELIAPGVTGLLVPPGNPQALADVLNTLIQDQTMRARLGKAAQAHSRCTFSLERYGREMGQLLKTSYDSAQAAKGKRKTVLFVHSSDDGYGADMVLLQVLEELDRNFFYPIVLLPDDTAHIGLLSPHLRRLNIEYRHAPLPILRRRYLTRRYFHQLAWRVVIGNLSLIRTIVRTNASIVYCNTLAVIPCALGAAMSGRPVLWHVHELLELAGAIRTVIHQILGRTSTRILVISNAVREHLLKDIPWASKKTYLIPNSIDMTVTPSISRSEARALLGVSQEALVVGMVGRISEWKGQCLLVRAMAILRDRGAVATTILVGDVFDNQINHLQDLKEEIRTKNLQDQVVLAGYVKQPVNILSTFDLFVLPSLRPEPFGLVVLEAMNLGIPTIASRHGGPVEIIRDGLTGLLVAPNDEVALADAIESLIANPERCAKIGKAASEEVRRTFDVRQFGTKIRGILTELAV